MASILASSLRAGKKVQDSAGGDQHLSKVVELGGDYHLFFRIVEAEDGEADLVAGLVPGRVGDYDKIKTSFIPFRKGMFEVDEAGDIKDLTGLDKWARIARVLHKAEMNKELKAAEKEAESAAADLGKAIDTVALARKLEGIKLDYEGGEAANGQPIYPTKIPAISGIKRKLTTQLTIIKKLPNGVPDFKNAKYAVLELSNARRDELLTILGKPEYYDVEDGYLEVGYTYVGSDKKEAGKNAKFQGITKDLSFAKLYPVEWENKGKKIIDGMANGASIDEIAEVMVNRNRNLKGYSTVQEIISTYVEYLSKNAAIFGSIDMDAEETGWAAKDILEAGLVNDMPKIKSALEKIVAENESKEEEDENSEQEAKEEKSSKKKSAKQKEKEEMQEAAGLVEEGVKSLKQLQQKAPDTNLDSNDEMPDLGDM